MEEGPSLRDKIVDKLKQKATLKQRVSDNTQTVFRNLKSVLHELAAELDETLEEMNNLDDTIKVEYRDRGHFEAQFQVAEDILIFNMQSDVFEFERNHPLWQNPYVVANGDNSYCGVINIYNFLADSFKYNRNSDEGYLIARIFVNSDMQYFVEGKNQKGVTCDKFGTAEIDKKALLGIAETAVDYALTFDLLVPNYESVKLVNVQQFNTKVDNSRTKTGKRLGYVFSTDDI
ncbi:MAG: hypothetical protein R3Y15_05520 [Rikenellaceae bacterium]